jgi:hypothetical protein
VCTPARRRAQSEPLFIKVLPGHGAVAAPPHFRVQTDGPGPIAFAG